MSVSITIFSPRFRKSFRLRLQFTRASREITVRLPWRTYGTWAGAPGTFFVFIAVFIAVALFMAGFMAALCLPLFGAGKGGMLGARAKGGGLNVTSGAELRIPGLRG